MDSNEPTSIRVRKGKVEEIRNGHETNGEDVSSIQEIKVVEHKEGRYYVAGNGEKVYTADPRLMVNDMRQARMKGKHNSQDFRTMLWFGIVIFFVTVIPSVLLVPRVEWPLMVQFCLILFFVSWFAIYFAMGSMVLRVAKLLAWVQVGLCLATLLLFSILHRDLRSHDQKRWNVLYGILVACFTVQTCWAIYFMLVVINLLHSYLIFTAVYSAAVEIFHLGKNTSSDDLNSTSTGSLLSHAIGADQMEKSRSYRFNRWLSDFFTLLWSKRRRGRNEPPLGTSVVGHTKTK